MAPGAHDGAGFYYPYNDKVEEQPVEEVVIEAADLVPADEAHDEVEAAITEQQQENDEEAPSA